MALPFAFLSYGIIHEGPRLAFVLFAVVVLASLIRNKWLSGACWYLLLWMVFICIYRMKFNLPQDVFVSALISFTMILSGIVAFIAVLKSTIRNETYYNIICLAVLIQASLAIFQYSGFDPVVWILTLITQAQPLLDPHTMTGTLGNPNFLAAFIAISLPFFFRRNWFYALITLVPILYITKTTSAVVPALIGTFFYFYPLMSFRIKIGIAVLCLSMGTWYAFFQHTPIHVNPRWKDWYAAIGLWASHPFPIIAGMGPGASWGKDYPMHNEWLECLYQYGVIGLSLLIGYVVTIYRRDRMLLTAFIIAAINMFGNYSLHLAPSAFLIIIIAALIERERCQTI
jgi:hypothetical protein